MPRLDTLLAMHAFCDASPWNHVDVRDAMAATVSAAGLSPGMRLPPEITGDVVLRALSSLRLDVSSVDRSLLTSIALDDPRSISRLDERVLVSANKLAVLFCLLCGGSLDAKLDACFAAADVDGEGRLSESHAARLFAVDAAPVAYAVAHAAGDHASLDWALDAWREQTRRWFRKHPGAPLDRRRFRALASAAVDAASAAAVDEPVVADAFASVPASGRARGRRSDDDEGGDAPQLSNQSNAEAFAAVLASVGLGGVGGGSDGEGGHRRNVSAASGGGGGGGHHDGARGGGGSGGGGHRRSSSTPAKDAGGGTGILWRLFDNISSGYTRGRSKTAGNEEELLGGGGKHRKTSSAGGGRSPARTLFSPRRSKTPSAAPAPGSVTPGAADGAATPTVDPEQGGDSAAETDANGRESDAAPSTTPKMTRSERKREELRAALREAHDETDRARDEQEETDAQFESALAFLQEVGVRMFLYNIVKMLLIIAVVAADASICVWTMFHFGIVVGLSLVMVINFGLAGLFGFFVLRYSARERGMMHMEYGQHMFKGVTDLLDKNALTGLGEQLATLTGNLADQGGLPPSRVSASRGDRSDGEDDYDSANGRGGSGRYADAV